MRSNLSRLRLGNGCEAESAATTRLAHKGRFCVRWVRQARAAAAPSLVGWSLSLPDGTRRVDGSLVCGVQEAEENLARYWHDVWHGLPAALPNQPRECGFREGALAVANGHPERRDSLHLGMQMRWREAETQLRSPVPPAARVGWREWLERIWLRSLPSLRFGRVWLGSLRPGRVQPAQEQSERDAAQRYGWHSPRESSQGAARLARRFLGYLEVGLTTQSAFSAWRARRRGQKH